MLGEMSRAHLVVMITLGACGGGPSPSTVGNEDLVGFWYAEAAEPPGPGARVLQFVAEDTYWDPIGPTDVYYGFDGAANTAESLHQGGTYRVEDGTISFAPQYEIFGGTTPFELPIRAYSGDRMTLESSTGTREYVRSDDCPWRMTRAGLVRFGLLQPTFSFESVDYTSSALSLAFDSQGALHTTLGNSGGSLSPRYSTTRGTCGLRTFDFPNSVSSDMAIDDDDNVHVAFITPEFELRYGRLPSTTSGELADWTFETIEMVQGYQYDLRLELRPDATPVVVNRLDVFEKAASGWSKRSRTPASITGIDTAMTPGGRLVILDLASINSLSVESDTGSFDAVELTAPGTARTTGGIDIDADGQFHLAIGASAGPGFANVDAIYYGTGASPDTIGWRELGPGSDPLLRVGTDGVVHIFATDHRRSISGLYTTLDGEVQRTYSAGIHRVDNFSRPALALSPMGQVAMGEAAIAVAVDDSPPINSNLAGDVELRFTGTGTIAVRGQECSASCTIAYEGGEHLRFDFVSGTPTISGCYASVSGDFCTVPAVPGLLGALDVTF